MIDPYPSEIRESLEASRRAGLDFESAWAAAMGEVGERETWPLRSMERIFREGYLRTLRRRCDLELSVSAKDPGERHVGEMRRDCRWGGGCEHHAVEGKRFCKAHLARLVKIRDIAAESLRETQKWPLRLEEAA